MTLPNHPHLAMHDEPPPEWAELPKPIRTRPNQGASQTLATPYGQTEPKAMALSRGKYPSGQDSAAPDSERANLTPSARSMSGGTCGDPAPMDSAVIPGERPQANCGGPTERRSPVGHTETPTPDESNRQSEREGPAEFRAGDRVLVALLNPMPAICIGMAGREILADAGPRYENKLWMSYRRPTPAELAEHWPE